MGPAVSGAEPEVERPFRGTGLVVVVISLLGLAFVLAVFVLCDSGRSVCFDTATHLTSDLAVLGFLLLFMVGIGLMTFPAEEPEVAGPGLPLPPPPPPLASTVPRGARDPLGEPAISPDGRSPHGP